MSFEKDYDLFEKDEYWITMPKARQMQETAFWTGVLSGAMFVAGLLLVVVYLV